MTHVPHLPSSCSDAASTCLIGVISDTHGLMRPEAIAALQGSAAIIHAGDIGNEAVLRTLREIAPIYAVRGNNDTAEWASKIPAMVVVTIAGVTIHVLHDIHDFDRTSARDVRVVIAGHSHRACIEEREGILFINPGSAGPRRFTLPVSVAKLEIHAQNLSATAIELDVPMPHR